MQGHQRKTARAMSADRVRSRRLFMFVSRLHREEELARRERLRAAADQADEVMHARAYRDDSRGGN